MSSEAEDLFQDLLPLELVALTLAGGDVLARLEHNNRNRTFRLRADMSQRSKP